MNSYNLYEYHHYICIYIYTNITNHSKSYQTAEQLSEESIPSYFIDQIFDSSLEGSGAMI